MLKKTISSAKAKCEFDFYLDGSLLADTVSPGVTEFRTYLELESPEPDDVIARIIRAAKRGCFAEQLVTTAVPLVSTYTVNGHPFQRPPLRAAYAVTVPRHQVAFKLR